MIHSGVLKSYVKPTDAGNKVVILLNRGFDDQWGDDRAMVYYNGQIHIFGVAITAVTSGNTHLVYDTFGNRLARFSAGFPARAGIRPSMILGKPVAFGGVSTTLGDVDIWKFDYSVAGNATGSWSQIVSDFSGSIGNRSFPLCCDHNGEFYVFGGQNQTTCYKTSNFTSWTAIASLPSGYEYLQSGACVSFKGNIYLIGGGHGNPGFGASALYGTTVSGRVLKYDPNANTYTLVYTDQEKFGQIWIDAVANSNYIYVIQGHIRDTMASQFPVGHVLGDQGKIYRSADAVTWEEVTNNLPRRHTTATCLVNGVPHMAAGAFCNDFFKIV